MISGRVQGVCYRMCACAEAQRLGVAGWVRNCPNGDVEVVAEAEEGVLEDFLRWCWRGPAHAIVRDIQADYEPASGEFDAFEIQH